MKWYKLFIQKRSKITGKREPYKWWNKEKEPKNVDIIPQIPVIILMIYAPIDKRQRMSDNFLKYPQLNTRIEKDWKLKHQGRYSMQIWTKANI